MDPARRSLLARAVAGGTALQVPDLAALVVEPAAARIKHGLDSWSSVNELTAAIQGRATGGQPPRGLTHLIGQTFELTPGEFAEPASPGSRGPSPVAVIEFPCTLRALDPSRRPVFRSTSGQRDVIQIHTRRWPAIEGPVVLQDLEIRDNRAWYDSGEAGVRLKDRFAGRSVRIERCDFVRCQNAVAGGSPGQSLHIIDCRIVDCGFGTQAHAVYVQPGELHFQGNLVLHSPGNRVARAHLLKSRALRSQILGNRFVMGDCPGSFLIDLPNGGDVELCGNQLVYGPNSDNSAATMVAYAAEGPAGDAPGQPPMFHPMREFRLLMCNNTLVSEFPGTTQLLVVDTHQVAAAAGAQVLSTPDPWVVDDNDCTCAGTGVWLHRDRRRGSSARVMTELLQSNPVGRMAPSTRTPAPANRGGDRAGMRFTGHNLLGAGAVAHRFTHRGAN